MTNNDKVYLCTTFGKINNGIPFVTTNFSQCKRFNNIYQAETYLINIKAGQAKTNNTLIRSHIFTIPTFVPDCISDFIVKNKY